MAFDRRYPILRRGRRPRRPAPTSQSYGISLCPLKLPYIRHPERSRRISPPSAQTHGIHLCSRKIVATVASLREGGVASRASDEGSPRKKRFVQNKEPLIIREFAQAPSTTSWSPSLSEGGFWQKTSLQKTHKKSINQRGFPQQMENLFFYNFQGKVFEVKELFTKSSLWGAGQSPRKRPHKCTAYSFLHRNKLLRCGKRRHRGEEKDYFRLLC